MICLLIIFKVTSQALGQSYDCSSACEVTLKAMCKIDPYQTLIKHNKQSVKCVQDAWDIFCVLCEVLIRASVGMEPLQRVVAGF